MHEKDSTKRIQKPVGNNMTIDSSVDRSWAMSHLPNLSVDEIGAMIDLLNCWFEKREWIIPEGCNVLLLWEYAERHGYSGIIGALSELGKVKDPQLISLGRKRYFTNILYHEKCMKICRDLQEKAIDLDIPIAFVKGPALSFYAFKDPGVRSFSDIDILVKSRDDAWALIQALRCLCHEDRGESHFRDRLMEPGRIHAQYNGWSLEFCYPIEWACDPMFDMLERHGDRILKTPALSDELAAPDPEMHFLLLMQHMARHLCSRFIWYLDVVAMFESCQDQIDFKWVEQELERSQMANISSLISSFCRKYIHREFPIFAQNQRGWNSRFQETMTSPAHLLSQISLFHSSGWRKHFTYLLSPCRFFLITDPREHMPFRNSIAARWLASRVMHVLQFNNRMFFFLMKKLLQIAGCPFCRIIALVLIWANAKAPQPIAGSV